MDRVYSRFRRHLLRSPALPLALLLLAPTFRSHGTGGPSPGSSSLRLLSLLAGAPALQAQEPGTSSAAGRNPRALTPGDSADLHARAREAQRRFVGVRVRHLPRRFSSRGGGCDDEVGRMCWRHGTGGRWSPEPEDDAVTRARDELLEELADVARQIPGDGWVLAQRVWYTGEGGRWEEALALARGCGHTERWWCEALQGLALHNLGRYAAAAGAFERALREMDDERAERWVDPSDLLDRTGRGLLDRDRGRPSEEVHEGSEKAVEPAGVRRLWALSDPFHLVEGNDRRTEHYARWTVATLRDGARNPHGLSWGSDLEELLVRYGWAIGWDRDLPDVMNRSSRMVVTGHEHPESRSWIPSGPVLERPLEAQAQEWVPGLAYAPSAYAPAYAPVVLPLDPVISVVPRTGGAVVGARFALPQDTTLRSREELPVPGELPDALRNRTPAAGLFLLDPETGKVVAGGERSDSLDATVTVEVPPGEYVVSVEAWLPDRRFGARYRGALVVPEVVPDVPVLSDLILVQGVEEPGTLRQALERVRPDLRVASGEPLRVVWELSGLGFRQEVLSYRLSLGPTDGSFFRRAGEWLGLVDEREPLTLGWDEAGPEAPAPVLRSILLDLPELDAGTYRLEVELETQGRGPAVRELVVEVVDPDLVPPPPPR